MEQPRQAVHRTILVVDVEGFGDQRRTNQHRLVVRDGMYRALQHAFTSAGIAWDACYQESCGDGVFVLIPAEVPKGAFVASVPDVLAAALREHNAAHAAGERIRLRMALHAGEVYYDEHGVTAASINLAFRLLDAVPLKAALAGSPGTLALIASSWFFDEVVRHSPAGNAATYRPIPVTVKETTTVAWICLPDHPYPPDPAILEAAPATPAPAAAAVGPAGQPGPAGPAGDPAPRAPRQLPARIPHFVGRRDEINELTRLLDEAMADDSTAKVLAVDGPGGIGKTALAVRWASETADRFPGGQLYVNLRGFDPSGAPMLPADVIRGFLDALGVPADRIPAGVETQAQLYRSLLAGQRMLVLLDNAKDADQVRPLLPGAGDAAVLVTSRRRLVDLEEAVPLTLGTLPPGEAEQLFTRLDPASAREPEAVSEVVRRCGYLPLAVRLLAGRLRHHPSWAVTDLIGALEETQNELEEIHAGSLTVAAVFELSYTAIPADQQRMFRGLGLHPGQDIDARAAAALDGFDLAGVRRLLDALYDNHLIEETARGRYGLHDLLRAYARTLAAADEAADREARTGRLLGYYLAAAQAADRQLALHADAAGPGADPSGIVPKLATWDQALAWMQAERLNLQACVEFAAGTGRAAEAAGIAAAMSTFLYDAGYWDQALTVHREAAAAAETAGDLAGQARALINLGAAQRLTDDYPAAVSTLDRALSLARETGDRTSQAQALVNLGAAQYMTDDGPGAIHAYRDALGLFRGLGDRPGQAIALCYLGGVQYESADYPAAAETLSQALALYRDLGDRLGQMNTLLWTGTLQRVTGDYLAAAGSLSRALELSRSLGNRLGEANALHYLGAVRGATGDHAAAATDLRLALDLFRSLGDRQGEANALCYLGDVQLRAGEYAAAADSLTQALEKSRQVGDRLAQAEALTGLGRLKLAAAGPDEANASFTEALGVATGLQSPLHQARALEGIGRCLARNGDEAAATGRLRQALEIYRRLRVPEAADVAAALASMHARDLPVPPASRGAAAEP
jgi:tetratricopeptide (TPR) repeat protein